MQQPRSESQSGDETDRVPAALTDDDAREVLDDGEVVGGRRLSWGSNYTFLVHLDAGPGKYLPAVYKPKEGERPLDDFPLGSLYKREYAAYAFSQALGWPDVPLTTIRDGPYGVGSFQLYLDADPEITYFELIEEHRETLLRFAVFDVAANNADRKGGHCLLGDDGRIWSIDHGLTFHAAFKMRTVMLELWGAPIPDPLLDDMRRVAAQLESNGEAAAALAEVLDKPEMDALHRRLESLLNDRVTPQLNPYVNVPWPLV